MRFRTFLMTAGVIGGVTALAGLASAVAEADKVPDGMTRPNYAMMLLQRFDTNADGVISAEEIKAAKAGQFKAMDSNGDGKISADELVAWQQARRAEFMLRRMDRTHDGVVDAADFQIAGSRQATMMLARYDTNGDGQLSGDELAAANRKPMGGPMGGMMHHGPGGVMSGPGPMGHGPMETPFSPDEAPEDEGIGAAP
jgi:Ca2+-binding EF-hand superfamily protein